MADDLQFNQPPLRNVQRDIASSASVGIDYTRIHCRRLDVLGPMPPRSALREHASPKSGMIVKKASSQRGKPSNLISSVASVVMWRWDTGPARKRHALAFDATIIPIKGLARTLSLQLREADARGVGAFAYGAVLGVFFGKYRRLGLTMCTKRALQITTCATLSLLTLAACRKPATWSDPAAHKIGFVTANGVRLQYLDWGGSGPALILIHGAGDNPHAFDDLAPAFTDRFRVIAYAQRGHGNSEVKGPYDTATMTEDLRAFMDSLGIAKANLAG